MWITTLKSVFIGLSAVDKFVDNFYKNVNNFYKNTASQYISDLRYCGNVDNFKNNTRIFYISSINPSTIYFLRNALSRRFSFRDSSLDINVDVA